MDLFKFLKMPPPPNSWRGLCWQYGDYVVCRKATISFTFKLDDSGSVSAYLLEFQFCRYFVHIILM